MNVRRVSCLLLLQLRSYRKGRTCTDSSLVFVDAALFRALGPPAFPGHSRLAPLRLTAATTEGNAPEDARALGSPR